MGVIKAKVVVQRPVEEGRPSSDDEILEPLDNDPVLEDVENQSPRRMVRASKVSPPSRGTTLALKKGRRSRHRYENEKLLTAQHEDELIWDVVDRSPHNVHRFSALDEEVMTRFYYGDSVNTESSRKERRNKNEEPEEFDPEVAYLNIGLNLRTALKKNLPVGMLAGLEEDIIDFFTENPQSFYIAEELSSFERLLAHACSSYHCLTSYSFNESGKRKLKIGNPKARFYKPDPCLSSYLQERFGRR